MPINAKRELAAADFCRATAETSPLATASVDGAGHIVRYVNPAFCLLVNKPKEEVIGKTFSAAVPGGAECLALLDRVYRTGTAETHTGQEYSPSHPLYWSYSMWPMLDADDRIAGTMIQVTKGTLFHEQAIAMNQALLIGSLHQHELTDAADALNAKLLAEVKERQQAQAEMQQANANLEEFSYAVSHDLQEPLRNVSLYVQLLARKLKPHLDSEAEGYIKNIVDGNKSMSALIRDLLAYAQVETDEQLDTSPVDCDTARKQALANLRSTVEETRAVVTCGPLPSLNASLPQLVQLFQNLIGNALKYRKPDCSPEIHIAGECCANEWVISVQDNGIGFEPRYAEQIFGVFKRLQSKQYAGTGIGLALCKRIVERHNGRIWAIGEVGKGATFFFTIPLKAG